MGLFLTEPSLLFPSVSSLCAKSSKPVFHKAFDTIIPIRDTEHYLSFFILFWNHKRCESEMLSCHLCPECEPPHSLLDHFFY